MDPVRSHAFLARALAQAALDPDLVQDVLGLCELAAITAETLAGEDVSVKHVADKLFLMADEARRVIEACRAQVALARSGAGGRGVRGQCDRAEPRAGRSARGRGQRGDRMPPPRPHPARRFPRAGGGVLALSFLDPLFAPPHRISGAALKAHLSRHARRPPAPA